VLDNRIPPPILLVAKGAAMVAAASVLPAAPLPMALRMGGFALSFGLAAVFGAPAVSAFAAARTTINPVHIDHASTLVTSGIYARSRNPMYVALTALIAALAFGLGNAWLLAAPVAYAAYLGRYQIQPEERAMAARFGSDYAAYKARVRRWL
jgi:protein-S-isoprenylcysteine O-methyltransferase Ste14